MITPELIVAVYDFPVTISENNRVPCVVLESGYNLTFGNVS